LMIAITAVSAAPNSRHPRRKLTRSPWQTRA
jgi:hypothetical protein